MKATNFNTDREDKKYADCLLHKNESIFKGTILDVFSNTVKIKFAIDGLAASVNKECLISEASLTSQQVKYVLPITSSDDSSTFDDSDADPDFVPSASHDDSTDDSSEGNEPDVATKPLVIFCKSSKPYFLAVLDETGGDTVHGIMLKPNEKRFFIQKVFDNAKSWNAFDPDIHCAESAISWFLNATCNSDDSTLEKLDTDGDPPAQLPKPKRKRNHANWEKSIQKRKRQAGEEYEYKSKSGEKKAKPAKMIKKTCSSNCSKECNGKISEEERMSIHKSYWSLESIDLKRMYLSKLVDTRTKVRERKRKVTKSGKRRTRKMSRVYHLIKPNSGIRVRVCLA